MDIRVHLGLSWLKWGFVELGPPKAALNFIKFEDENEDEDEPRNKEESLTSRTGAGLETAPEFRGQQAEEDDGDLAANEEDQPFERRVREPVAVQADAKHVHAEPGQAGDDVAERRRRFIRPRSRTRPPQRACRMSAFQSTMSSAPFSFGSQPQNRPQDWSAQMPPRTVPTKLNSVAKQTMP